MYEIHDLFLGSVNDLMCDVHTLVLKVMEDVFAWGLKEDIDNLEKEDMLKYSAILYTID